MSGTTTACTATTSRNIRRRRAAQADSCAIDSAKGCRIRNRIRPANASPTRFLCRRRKTSSNKCSPSAKLGKDDVVYDLGSGDGRIVIEAAKKYGCRSVGLEIDRDLVKLSQERAQEAKVEKVWSPSKRPTSSPPTSAMPR